MKKILKILRITTTILILMTSFTIIIVHLIFINIKKRSEEILNSISKNTNISINIKNIEGKFYKFTPLIKIKNIYIKLPYKNKILINKLYLKINIKKTIYNLKLCLDNININKFYLYINKINIQKNNNIDYIKSTNIFKIINKIKNIKISQGKIFILNKIKKKYNTILFNTIIYKTKILKKKEIKHNLLNNKVYNTRIKISFKTNKKYYSINKSILNIKKIKIHNIKIKKQKNSIKGSLNLFILNKNDYNEIKIKSFYYQIINKKKIYFIYIKNTKIKLNNKNKKIKLNIKYININNNISLKKKKITFYFIKRNNINKYKKKSLYIYLYNKNINIQIKNYNNINYTIYIKFIKYTKNTKRKTKLLKLKSKINFNIINFNNINYATNFSINLKNKSDLLHLLISTNKKIININTIIQGNAKKIDVKIKIEKKQILSFVLSTKKKTNFFSYLLNINNLYLFKSNIYKTTKNKNKNLKTYINNLINNVLLNKIPKTNDNLIKYIKINVKNINILQKKYKNFIFILNNNKKNKITLKFIKKNNIIEIIFNKNKIWKLHIHCINHEININKILINKKDTNKCWLNNIILYIKNINIYSKKISFDIYKKKNLNLNAHIILYTIKKYKLIIYGNIYGKNIQNLFNYVNIKIPINNSSFFIKYNLIWNKLLSKNPNNSLNGFIKIDLNENLIKNINFNKVKKIIKKIIIKLIFMNINIKTDNIIPKEMFFKKILIKSKINRGILYLNDIILDEINEIFQINGEINLNKNEISINTIVKPKIYKSIKLIEQLLINKIIKLKIKFLNYLKYKFK